MTASLPVNRCRACGATSYQRLTHRGADGAMQYNGVCRCSGCGADFSDLSGWRERRAQPRRSERQSTSGEGPHEDRDASSNL